jgi:hypothetical protein
MTSQKPKREWKVLFYTEHDPKNAFEQDMWGKSIRESDRGERAVAAVKVKVNRHEDSR